MTKVINKEKFNKDVDKMVNSKEVRSLSKYIRTHGEYRSGLTTSVDGGALVPSELVTTAEDVGSGKFQLKPYLNTVLVNTARGSYPVMNPTTSAHSKDELAKYPDLADGITEVPYKVQSYAGKITLSDELLEDSSAPLAPMLTQNLSNIMINTQNRIIMEKMATLEATKVSTMDDVITAITSGVDPRFLKNVFVGQAAYAKLRTMKDGQGRYILNSNDNTIAGVQVVVIPNVVGNANDIYIGDLSAALTYFDRNSVNINYANNNLFAQSLAAVMRADVEVSYAPALKRLTFVDPTK